MLNVPPGQSQRTVSWDSYSADPAVSQQKAMMCRIARNVGIKVRHTAGISRRKLTLVAQITHGRQVFGSSDRSVRRRKS